ncbi:MAG: TPM domain-containing protein [Burkholderiales bacterium]|nr:TPM domain-containing protein [Burkholderiales bacterium]
MSNATPTQTRRTFWQRWSRLLRQLWSDPATLPRRLGIDTTQRVQQAVQASELRHSGEIRVCIEAGLPMSYAWRDASPRERAVSLFGKLRVWDTEANNGVLIYLLMADHAIEIVADRGLHRHVSDAQWQAIVAHMHDDFRARRFEAGLLAAVAAVDAMLVEHYPRHGDTPDHNELPDEPVLR